MRCPNHLNRNVAKRGVCLSCYELLAKRVERGQATWTQLEFDGLIAPKQKPGPRAKTLKPAYRKNKEV